MSQGNYLPHLFKLADAVSAAVRSCEDHSYLGEYTGMGADGTPTKRIDAVAEGCVLELLDKLNLPLNVLSEEAGFVDRGHEETLVLDPIDGTYNALHGIPFYSVSLAVGEKCLSDIHTALVRDLVHGSTYWAERGKGAYLDGKQIATLQTEREDTLFSVMLSRRASSQSFKIGALPKRTRNLGSAALEMCMVADGTFEVYYNAIPGGSLRITDIAAASLILREAGGEVFNDRYEILEMVFDVRERKNVIAMGNRRYAEILQKIRR